jgi:hypothetical protein
MSKWARFTTLVLMAAVLLPLPGRAASVGALFGLGRQGISGDTPPNTSYGAGAGVIAGVQGEIALSSSIGLSVQPRFTQRRTTLTSVDDESNESTLDLKLDYVSVPILLKFGAGRTYFAGGMDFGFLQTGRITGTGVDEDIADRFHNVDVGAVFGFGVVFPVGRPKLTTELRYVQGLVNLSNDSGDASTALPDRFHSGGLELMAGILFPLGGR